LNRLGRDIGKWEAEEDVAAVVDAEAAITVDLHHVYFRENSSSRTVMESQLKRFQ
jgi:hypothetical protein